MAIKRQEVLVGSSSDWTFHNSVLADGQLAVDRTVRGLKIGDGSASWSALEFLDESSITHTIDGGTP